MSYPRSLHEFTDRELQTEVDRRRKCHEAGLCSYCNRTGDDPACAFAGRHAKARRASDNPQPKEPRS